MQANLQTKLKSISINENHTIMKMMMKMKKNLRVKRTWQWLVISILVYHAPLYLKYDIILLAVLIHFAIGFESVNFQFLACGPFKDISVNLTGDLGRFFCDYKVHAFTAMKFNPSLNKRFTSYCPYY